MLCVLILGVCSALVGFKSHTLIGHYRARYSEQRLKNELQLARSLSLCYQVDVTVKGHYEGNYLHVTKGADDPQVYLAQFCKRPLKLFFIGERKPEPFTATYYSNGYSTIENLTEEHF